MIALGFSRRLAGLLSTVLLLVVVSACSGGPLSSAESPTATAATSPSTSGAAGYRVVFTASTTSGSEVFLYDAASSAPQQLVTLGAGVPPQVAFVTSQKIAYTDSVNQTASRIITVDLSTHATTTEITATGYVPAFAYSHDGSMLAYLVHGASGKAVLHLRRNGQEATLDLNPIPGRGTSRDDEVTLQYAPDDKYLLMVDTFVGDQGQAPKTGQFLVLRTDDNTLAFAPPPGVSSNATMATWARHSDRLYYRDAIGVRTWDAGSTSVGTLVTALHWYDPAVSSDDRLIAYTDIDAQFVPHVAVLDLQTNQAVKATASSRSHPIFITSELVWYLEEQPCQSECLGGPSQTSGKVLAYNLKSKSETGLPFSDVHTLSQLAVIAH